MTDILPTYRCFDDAMELIEIRVKESPTLYGNADAIALVHAICIAQDGTRYVHGWVEEDGQVWDAGILHGARVYFAVAREEYYAAKHVEETTRYTLRDIWRENSRSGHYGPWKPAYLALCGSGDKRVLGRLQLRVPTELREGKPND